MRWGYYGEMGVHRGAAQQDYDAAWRRLSRAEHPDARPGLEGAELLEANERFARLTEARAATGTAAMRRAYDGWLDAFCGRCPECSGKGFRQSLSGGALLRRACGACSGHGAVPLVAPERTGRA